MHRPSFVRSGFLPKRGGAVDGQRCDEKHNTLRSVEGPSNGIATEYGVLWGFQRALQTRKVQVVLLCFTASGFHESQASSEESWGFLRTAADFIRAETESIPRYAHWRLSLSSALKGRSPAAPSKRRPRALLR